MQHGHIICLVPSTACASGGGQRAHHAPAPATPRRGVHRWGSGRRTTGRRTVCAPMPPAPYAPSRSGRRVARDVPGATPHRADGVPESRGGTDGGVPCADPTTPSRATARPRAIRCGCGTGSRGVARPHLQPPPVDPGRHSRRGWSAHDCRRDGPTHAVAAVGVGCVQWSAGPRYADPDQHPLDRSGAGIPARPWSQRAGGDARRRTPSRRSGGGPPAQGSRCGTGRTHRPGDRTGTTRPRCS